MREITFRKFLKTFTAVSEKFVDEYVSFYEKCENNTFGIYAEDVIKFLDVKNKKRFYDDLKKNYKKYTDYVVKNMTDYYITQDTFDRICISSETKKGDQVRDYFIITRQFIQYYKDYMNGMPIRSNIKKSNKRSNIKKSNKRSSSRSNKRSSRRSSRRSNKKSSSK